MSAVKQSHQGQLFGIRNARPRLSTLLILMSAGVFCGTLFPVRMKAETLEEQLSAVRAEIQHLRQEVDGLKKELQQQKRATGQVNTSPVESNHYEEGGTGTPRSAPSSAASTSPEIPAAEAVPLLQAQIAEQAQTKVESNSRLPVKIFGSMVVNTFYNSAEANWIELPDYVNPNPAPPLPAGSFNMTLRQSRLGAIINGPTMGPWQTTGVVALDFFGGSARMETGTFIGTPRLLYAYARIGTNKTVLLVGQDQMILAPRNPTSLAALAVPDLYRSGNLYLRVPQIKIERKFDAGKLGDFRASAGVVAPLGGYLSYGYPAGARSRQPAFQGRVAWSGRPATPGNETPWEIGVSGHHGRDRYLNGQVTSWASALDFDVRHGRFGFGGEAFMGNGIGTFGGALGQIAEAMGGYLEARLQATRKLSFNGGAGTDQVIESYIDFAVPLDTNRSYFVNTIYRLTPEVASSFEYRWLATTPTTGGARSNHHFNLVVAYSF